LPNIYVKESLSSNVIVSTYTHTHTQPTALSVPLKCSVRIYLLKKEGETNLS